MLWAESGLVAFTGELGGFELGGGCSEACSCGSPWLSIPAKLRDKTRPKLKKSWTLMSDSVFPEIPIWLN